MAAVETVNGPIDVEGLGRTLSTSTSRTHDEAMRFQFPHLYDDEEEWNAAISDAHAVKGHGIATVVEPSAMFLHRDAAFSKRVADDSGLQIVLATGIYTYDHLPQALLSRNEDEIADIFVHEIENGMGTGIKAAFIKCAADEPGVTPNVEKVHRAAARASNRTGKPIMAHSRPASGTGPEQMRIFKEEESSRTRCRSPTPATRRSRLHRAATRNRLLDRDGPLRHRHLPPDRPAERDDARPARARLRRPDVHLQDYCSTIDWFPREIQEYLKANEVPDWSMTFLFEKVIPELKERGLSDEQLDRMMVENEALARVMSDPLDVRCLRRT